MDLLNSNNFNNKNMDNKQFNLRQLNLILDFINLFKKGEIDLTTLVNNLQTLVGYAQLIPNDTKNDLISDIGKIFTILK